MNKLYTLKSALLSNSSGQKCDANAAPASIEEVIRNQEFFEFDFIRLHKEYVVYKLCAGDQADKVEGLVGFRSTPGILECANMEASIANRRGKPLYSGIGKALIALCCKISFDHGMDGFIYFDAKKAD